MTFKTTGALALAALTLAACNNPGRPMAANGKICASFKTAQPAATGALALPSAPGADAAAPVDECLRRWAYSLAPSTDGASDVADAAVAACGGVLSRWNQAGLTQAPAADGAQALSLTNGQPTNPLAEHYAFAQGRAMFYVVQARAGRCAPPPAVNGLPSGVG